MHKQTLDERCAELKARMRSAEDGKRTTSTTPTSMKSPHRATATLRPDPKPIEPVAPVEIRNPVPLVKAALAGMREVQEQYGRLQFRWRGYVDVRVSKASARRALKFMDVLIKRVEALGLTVQVRDGDRGGYRSSHGLTFVTDNKERVQVTVIEKTGQRANPAWNSESPWSIHKFLFDPTGRLTIVLDEDRYSPEKWIDKRGHHIEEYVDAVVHSIQQSLVDKAKARIEAEEHRKLEAVRQQLRADADRQHREQAQRVEDLKGWTESWAAAERMRAFLAAWEQRNEAVHGPIALGSPADGFRRWVSLVIEEIDPL
jgi:hypothetical protein